MYNEIMLCNVLLGGSSAAYYRGAVPSRCIHLAMLYLNLYFIVLLFSAIP
jgi:hypothetical protein